MAIEGCAIRQQNDITRISQQLRNAYYRQYSKIIDDCSEPFGGSMTESIGAWPEFILKGTFCSRSRKGFCSPCFYSRFPLSDKSRLVYYEMISKQVSYVIDNFEKFVISRQYGQVSEKQTEVSFVFTPTGSFFDNYEFPIDIRLYLENQLVRIAEERHIELHLHIESHCEDFNSYDLSDEKFYTEIELLNKLNTKVIFGFESVNEYARNVLYNKQLELSKFETAAEKAFDVGLAPGAFVFAGLFAYNDLQTHDDVLSSISYLLSKNIFPVLMFQNAQPYTITDVLLKQEIISLLEPLTVAWIISDTIALLEGQPSYWLIADPVGGPPEPDCHIFKNPRYTCPDCSEAIYSSLVELRTTRSFDKFLSSFAKIKQCDCYKRYINYIETLIADNGLIKNKTDELLKKCQHCLKSYLQLGK